MRRGLVLALSVTVGCPNVDLDGLTYPCAGDDDCPAEQACDAIDGVCTSIVLARHAPEARPATAAYGELLGLGIEDGAFVRWYARGAFTRTADLRAHDDGEGAMAHALERDDVVAIAKRDGDLPYTYYRFGRMARGQVSSPDRGPVETYEGPEGLVGVAIAPDGSSVAWLDDDTVAYGTPEILAATDEAAVTWPIGKRATDADAFAIDNDGTAWVVFRDGTVASGTPEDFTRTVRPGRLVGFDVSAEPNRSGGHDAFSFLYFATGWCKVLDGTPEVAFAPQSAPWTGDWSGSPAHVVDGAWIELADDRRPDEILDVGIDGSSVDGSFLFYVDGVRAKGDGPFVFRRESLSNITPEVGSIYGIGMVDGSAFTFLDDESVHVALDVANPILTSTTDGTGRTSTSALPRDQRWDTILAIGGEEDETRPPGVSGTTIGSIWAIFSDGSISEGRSNNLATGDPKWADLGYFDITAN